MGQEVRGQGLIALVGEGEDQEEQEGGADDLVEEAGGEDVGEGGEGGEDAGGLFEQRDRSVNGRAVVEEDEGGTGEGAGGLAATIGQQLWPRGSRGRRPGRG